ncbi:MAG: hypothetical protein AAGJ83_15290, partial [Planctomycetota bacterium]
MSSPTSYTPLISYLRSPSPGLWSWCDSGDTVAWSKDGATLTFAKEMKQVLSIFTNVDGKLPSFTAMVISVAAATGRVERQELENRLSDWSGGPRTTPQSLRQVAGAICSWKDLIGQTPEIPDGATGVAIIVAFALRDARDWLKDTADVPSTAIIEELACHPDERVSIAANQSALPDRTANQMQKRAWDTLKQLAHRPVDPHELTTWLRTGLLDLPTPDEVPPVDPTPVSSLLKSVREDQDSEAGLACVARTALAVTSLVSLPRSPSQPDALPTGGFSDITNRGTPDRLLISELASPDDLLLARIATGEALYIRREVPLGPTPPLRPVLIEQTLACWGDTRIRMVSLALAYAMMEERQPDTRCTILSV